MVQLVTDKFWQAEASDEETKKFIFSKVLTPS
jgi:hypothetical protein